MISRSQFFKWMPNVYTGCKTMLCRAVRHGEVLPFIYQHYFSDREAKEYAEYKHYKPDYDFNIADYSYFGFSDIQDDPDNKIVTADNMHRLLETDLYMESNIVIHPDIRVYRYELNFVTNRAYLYNNIVRRFRPWAKLRTIVLACTNSTRDKLYKLRDDLHRIYPYTVSVIDLDYIEDRDSYGYENCWQLWPEKKDVKALTHDKEVKFRRQYSTIRTEERS